MTLNWQLSLILRLSVEWPRRPRYVECNSQMIAMVRDQCPKKLGPHANLRPVKLNSRLIKLHVHHECQNLRLVPRNCIVESFFLAQVLKCIFLQNEFHLKTISIYCITY